MTSQHQPDTRSEPLQEPPWYRQFWPWFIIALPAAAVIASLITLYLAVSRPVQLVVDDEEYRRLNDELKAHPVAQESEEDEPAGPHD